MAVNSSFFVSVIAPLYNDADILGPFFQDTASLLKSHYQNYEFILVDDGSSDTTPQILEQLLKIHDCARYIRLSRRFGLEEAISAGLDTAIGDVAIVLDPQYDPPGLIPEMAQRVKQTGGIVYGVKKDRLKEPLLYHIGKKIFYKIGGLLIKSLPPENATFFIGLSRQSLNAIIQIKNESRFIRVFGSYVGFNRQVLEYKRVLRRKAMRCKNIFEGLDYAMSIIVNNTTYPLKIASYLGLLISCLNALYIGYILFVAISRQRVVEGWMSSSFQISIMFLFVFIILTGLCEYMSRLIDESKHRPPYFIEEEKNSSVMCPEEYRKNIVKDTN